MMGFVEYEQVDLSHRDEGVHQTLREYFCSAYNDHVLGEVSIPGRLVPQTGAHSTAHWLDTLIEAAAQNVSLLEDQIDRIDLCDVSEQHEKYRDY
jgi:bifunctional pyridoxal-dependent enzyme with beta-cystathionase and maltose regulon repressor activities